MTHDHRLEEWLLEWQERFEEGREIAPAELCADAPELVPELERRIAFIRGIQKLIADPTYASSEVIGNETLPESPAPPPAVEDLPPRDAIPGYEILAVIGRGGMGVVYKARQLALNRIVALKMILAGDHAGTQARARFMQEAETVARITHPNVVGIFDFGTHDGKPFFSMEFVEGGSLAERIRGEPQPPREAAQLVQTLAIALQAAHDAGVVHRDLKPDNILLQAIASSDVAIPKITDFGLARSGESGLTASDAVMGTPSYMSPEQAAGQMRQVGFPSDIWALGAILYETLTGRSPFKGTSVVETLHMVRNDDPVPPSRLQPKIPRDLETICLKCLQKDPHRRYGSAAALAADLQRFLDGEVIHARPVGRLERMARWCRRNPRDAGLVMALLLTLLGGFAGMTVLWRMADHASSEAIEREREANRQKSLADEQREIAQKNEHAANVAADQARSASEFLAGIFEASDPLGLTGYGSLVPRESGESLTARELLNRAMLRLNDSNLVPESKAMLMERIGSALVSLGDFERAEPLLVDALAIRRSVLDPNHRDVASSAYSLGWLYHTQGRYPEAETLYRESLTIREQFPDVERDLATSCFSLAWLLTEMEELSAAREFFERSASIRERILGKEHRDVALARIGVASVLLEGGEYLKAVDHSRRGMETLLGAEKNSDVARAVGLFQQAVVTDLGLGDPVTAEKLLIECEQLVRVKLGDRHVYRALVLGQLAHAQWGVNAKDRAEATLRECLTIVRLQVGMTHPRAATAINNLAVVLREQGKRDEAEKLYVEWVSEARRGGARRTFLADALVSYSDHMFHVKQETRERELLEEALKLFRAEPKPPRRKAYLHCLSYLAWNYSRHRRYVDAEPIAREYLSAAQRIKGDAHNETINAQYQLGRLLVDRGQSSAEVESLLSEAKKRRRPLTPFSTPHEDYPDILLAILEMYQLRGDTVQVAKAARECRSYATKPSYLIDVAECLTKCERLAPQQGHAEEAVKLIAEAVRKGYSNGKYLRTASALAPLRSRDDFRKVLAMVP